MPVRAVSMRDASGGSRHWASVIPAIPCFADLLFENGQICGGLVQGFLQRGESLLVLTQASHDADVGFRAGMVFGAS